MFLITKTDDNDIKITATEPDQVLDIKTALELMCSILDIAIDAVIEKGDN